MFRCGKTLIAPALLVAIPIAATAQTVDNPPVPSDQAQPAGQPPVSAELLKPSSSKRWLHRLRSILTTCWQMC